LQFLAATGFTTHRYVIDFVPMLLWVAAVNVALWRALVPRLLAVAAIGFGVAVSLALGISGPYDEMLRNRPAGYLKIECFNRCSAARSWFCRRCGEALV